MKKLLLFLILAISLPGLSQKISELPAASSVNGSDLLPIVQSGVTKKAQASMIINFIRDSLDNVRIISDTCLEVAYKGIVDTVCFSSSIEDDWNDDGSGNIENNNSGTLTLNGTIYAPTLPTATKVYWIQHWNNSTGRFEKVSPLSFYRDLQDDLRDLSEAGTPDTNAIFLKDHTDGRIYQADITDKVGIGKTTPTEMLDVSGNINFPLSSPSTGTIKQHGNVIFHTYDSYDLQSNTFLGKESGNFTNTSYENTAVGFEAMTHLGAGSYWNTAVGSNALHANIDGTTNTAIGAYSLAANTTGWENTAIGHNSLRSNTEGELNCAMGEGALEANTTGSGNTAIGNETLLRNTTGHNNTTLGNWAMYDMKTGNKNIGIGYYAALNFLRGSNNIIICDSCETTDTTANYQLNIGNAIKGSLDPANRYAIIEGSLYVNGDAEINGHFEISKNIKLSASTSLAGQILQDGSRIFHTYTDNASQPNIFIGLNAGNFTTTGNFNNTIGNNALAANTTGAYNFAGGSNAALSNTEGSYNMAIGVNALYYNKTGTNNVAIGYGAQYGISLDNVSSSVSIGTEAGLNNMGDGNIAIGTNAMSGGGSSTGADNVCIGALVMYPKTTGSRNVGIGKEALRQVTSGTYNVAIGFQAGYSITTGQSNVMLGYNAGKNWTGSNGLFIDNSDTDTPLIGGDFDANTVTINGTVSATGGTYSTFYKLTPSADPPSSAAEGMIYYDSDDKKIKVYNGTTWVDLF